MDWELVKVFLAIYRFGTFAGAAQYLSVNESTVRRRLFQLEQFLGKSLFFRQDGRLEFDKHNHQMLEVAQQIEIRNNLFIDFAGNSRKAGSVRISMIDLFAIHFAPDIARFKAQNPDIVLDITTEPHIIDLSRDGVDIAIRMARPTRGDHKLRRFGTIDFQVYGSRDYIASLATDPTAKHQFLVLGVHFTHADHEFELSEEFWRHDLATSSAISVQTDCYPVMLRLCEAGIGLAMLPCFLADASPLLNVYELSARRRQIDIWGVVRQESASLPKVRQVIDFLDELIRRNFEPTAGD